MKLVLLIFKNLRRNLLRSALTGLAIIVLVFVFTMIATVLRFLDAAMADRTADVQVVLTERYRLPSRFDKRFIDDVSEKGALHDQLMPIKGFDDKKTTLWHFVGFTTDPDMQDKNLQFFCIATIPEKIPSMIEGLENLDPKLCEKMKNPERSRLPNIGVLMGPDRLKTINKKVGDVFKAKSISHREGKTGARAPIEMEFEIVGELPAESRWAQGAFMDYEYLDRVLKEQNSELYGTVNLGWIKLANQDAANQSSMVIEKWIPDVKSETASAAVSRFLEGYKSLLNGVRYVLAPAIIIVMVLIVANAISITVRERVKEMAVLKVIGFSPGQILILVLGEGLLLGMVCGFLGALATYLVINRVVGGINVRIGFFPVFFIPWLALVWGPLLGGFTAFCGGLLPALGARAVRVSEVFAKVA